MIQNNNSIYPYHNLQTLIEIYDENCWELSNLTLPATPPTFKEVVKKHWWEGLIPTVAWINLSYGLGYILLGVFIATNIFVNPLAPILICTLIPTAFAIFFTVRYLYNLTSTYMNERRKNPEGVQTENFVNKVSTKENKALEVELAADIQKKDSIQTKMVKLFESYANPGIFNFGLFGRNNKQLASEIVEELKTIKTDEDDAYTQGKNAIDKVVNKYNLSLNPYGTFSGVLKRIDTLQTKPMVADNSYPTLLMLAFLIPVVGQFGFGLYKFLEWAESTCSSKQNDDGQADPTPQQAP